jgi:MFS family permease
VLPDARPRRPSAVARRVARRLHAAASADGAGSSGLAALLWTHALQSAGDALVAVSLASTAFFQVSASEARGKIALYLLLTLLPFSFLVPVAGPLLDRFPHGRRNVLALACGGRGLVAWTLAGSLASLSLYPQALLILVLARAYGVARSAAVVRVQPPAIGLVASNARLNVASVASSGAAAAVGVAVANTLGTAWVLRLATLLFVAAAVAAIRLPAHVDDAHDPDAVSERWGFHQASRQVRRAVAATTSLRALSGLLTLGLAILLKANHASAVEVGVVLGAAVVGSLIGTGLASRMPARRTARLTAVALMLPSAACLLAALGGTTALRALAVGSVGMGASLGKYALDASLQAAVGPRQLGSAFSRSETSLQLGWALGGGLGLVASLTDKTALGGDGAVSFVFVVATGVAVSGLVVAARWSRQSSGSA